MKKKKEKTREVFHSLTTQEKMRAHTRKGARAHAGGGEPVENQQQRQEEPVNYARITTSPGSSNAPLRGPERVPRRIIFKNDTKQSVNPQSDAWNHKNFTFQEKKTIILYRC